MGEGSDQVIQKVILLYISDQLAGLTQDDLMSIAIDTIYMDYFDFSLIYESLVQDGFLIENRSGDDPLKDTAGKPVTRVEASPRGREILNSLFNSVPLPVRNHLKQMVNLHSR